MANFHRSRVQESLDAPDVAATSSKLYCSIGSWDSEAPRVDEGTVEGLPLVANRPLLHLVAQMRPFSLSADSVLRLCISFLWRHDRWACRRCSLAAYASTHTRAFSTAPPRDHEHLSFPFGCSREMPCSRRNTGSGGIIPMVISYPGIRTATRYCTPYSAPVSLWVLDGKMEVRQRQLCRREVQISSMQPARDELPAHSPWKVNRSHPHRRELCLSCLNFRRWITPMERFC